MRKKAFIIKNFMKESKFAFDPAPFWSNITEKFFKKKKI